MERGLRNQKGFTLAEIAIVLVIIGLLIAAVLKAEELIRNAEIKSLSDGFEDITTAYFGYRDRKGTYPDTSSDSAFWYSLRSEGFLIGELGSDSDSVGPEHALKGKFVFVQNTTSGLKESICAEDVDGKAAKSVDVDLDDGEAETGRVRSQSGDEYVAGTDVNLCKQLWH